MKARRFNSNPTQAEIQLVADMTIIVPVIRINVKKTFTMILRKIIL
jgi:hypothetical protein